MCMCMFVFGSEQLLLFDGSCALRGGCRVRWVRSAARSAFDCVLFVALRWCPCQADPQASYGLRWRLGFEGARCPLSSFSLLGGGRHRNLQSRSFLELACVAVRFVLSPWLGRLMVREAAAAERVPSGVRCSGAFVELATRTACRFGVGGLASGCRLVPFALACCWRGRRAAHF